MVCGDVELMGLMCLYVIVGTENCSSKCVCVCVCVCRDSEGAREYDEEGDGASCESGESGEEEECEKREAVMVEVGKPEWDCESILR